MSRSLSVVIPAHNAASFLPAAIASIQRQHAVDPSQLEIIVVDDGSTDETRAVAAAIPGVIYRQQPRAGAAQARNAGVALATGAWLAFLDADDYWSDDKIAHQWACLEASRHEMVFGHAQEFQTEDGRIGESAAPVIPTRCAGTLLMRRDDFLRVGPFSTTWRVGEFIDWCLRATELGLTSSMLDEVVLYRRLHAGNSGRTAGSGREDYARIIKQALDRRREAARGAG